LTASTGTGTVGSVGVVPVAAWAAATTVMLATAAVFPTVAPTPQPPMTMLAAATNPIARARFQNISVLSSAVERGRCARAPPLEISAEPV
jgi:hypothetical protein